MSPEISIVIPTLGRPAMVERVLERLDRQTVTPGAFEVLVVADAKEERADELERAVAAREYSARCLRAPKPGASAARNAGWTRPGIGKTGTTQTSESVAFVGGTGSYAVSSLVFADGSAPGEVFETGTPSGRSSVTTRSPALNGPPLVTVIV